MLVMTAKVDRKKILLAVGALLLAIGALFGIVGNHDRDATPTAVSAAPSAEVKAATNDERVQFLQSFGWEVTVSPTETMQVRIPTQSSEIYDRYNQLQQSQGYDLAHYAGKTVSRYVYLINNYPGATEPVYATLLVYQDRIIGGDITNSGPNGLVQGFAMTVKEN